MTTGAFFFFAYLAAFIFMAFCAGLLDWIDIYRKWRKRRG